jgi:hypothetical protein
MLTYELKMKLSKGFGGPEVWPSIVWFLNGLPAKVSHGEMVLKQFQKIQTRQA